MLYLEKPEQFDNPMETVGCFVECHGTILLLRRHPDKSEGGVYCSPGGKMDLEDGGDSHKAALRELFEETGIQVNPEEAKLVATFYVTYPGGTKHFIYHKYIVVLNQKPEVTLSQTEHTDFVWVTPEQALTLPLIFDEDACIKYVYKDK